MTPSDNLDGDLGPNDLQNIPILTSARTDGTGTIVIDDKLNIAASMAFRA